MFADGAGVALRRWPCLHCVKVWHVAAYRQWMQQFGRYIGVVVKVASFGMVALVSSAPTWSWRWALH